MAAIDLTAAPARITSARSISCRSSSARRNNLLGLLTLTYVPNYFDILPMYLVILAMMPLVMALSLISRWLVAAFVAGLWLATNWGGLGLPAEPWSNRQWFFNPFGWQLIFFTGFAFMRGWLPAPPVRVWLLVAAGVIVLARCPLPITASSTRCPSCARRRPRSSS